MKKVFLTLAIALGLTTAANAQDVGKMWVGGTVGFSATKTTYDDNTKLDFKVLPEFGYILSENIGIGIALGGAHTNVSDELWGDTQVNTYIVNPFLRYTFLKGDIGALFFDAGAAYGHQKYVNKGPLGQSLEVGFKPGVAINVSDNIALIGKFGFLGWQYQHLDPKTPLLKKSHSNKFGFDFDMTNIQIGASLKF